MRITQASFVTVILIATSSLLSTLSRADPSFDCAKAFRRVEHVICNSEKLPRQDTKLTTLYANVMSKLTDDARVEVRKEQRIWLGNRNELCHLNESETETCLLKVYRERNSELALLLAFDSTEHPDNLEALKILRITPRGNDAPAGQQIVIQFDRPVVPIGRMERDDSEIPIKISPKLDCEWRWINTSAFACQLRKTEKMTEATRYTVEIGNGIRTESGIGMREATSHSFTTVRPRITYQRFVNWLTPGTPLIQVTFNQPVTKASVEQSMTMTARRSKDRESVPVVAHPDNMPRTVPYWMRPVEESDQPKVNDQLTDVDGDEARKVWVVEPSKELPGDQTIWLDVRPGLVSSSGPESGIERRTVVSFETYPEFEFLGIRCRSAGSTRFAKLSKEVLVLDASRSVAALQEESLERCAPLKPVALVFSSPVKNSMVRDHVSFSPRLDGDRKDYDPWDNVHDLTRLSAPHRTGRKYYVWLPELLQAYETYDVEIDSTSLTDEFDRKLDELPRFRFFTAHREPRLRLTHPFAVLESEVESRIPLYVTNLESIGVSYQRLTASGADAQLSHLIDVPQVGDIAFALPMGVRELLGNESGAIYGRLTPNPAPPGHRKDPQFFAQLSPFQVHVKVGHFSSLVWVTSFAEGDGVENARVTLFKGTYENLVGLSELRYPSLTDKHGMAKLPGTAEIDPRLEHLRRYHRHDEPRFFVKVEKDDGVALIPLDRSFQVRSSGARSNIRRQGGHTHTWGTTAQGVYKLGDVVEYKIFVRDQSEKHWILPEEGTYTLKVVDPQRKTVHERSNIRLSEFGALTGEFKVSEQGAVGWYRFQLSPSLNAGEKSPRYTWRPMSVLVSDFTPSPFKVSTELNGDSFRAGDRVEVSSLATLHSGGPFTDAEIRLTARLSPKPFASNDPRLKRFVFGSSRRRSLSSRQAKLLDIRGKLDDFGQYEDVFLLPEVDIYYGSVLVESAVKDDRGKFVASTAKADYAGRDRFVGLRNTQWLYKKGKPARIEVVVVDERGEIVPGAKIDVAVNRRVYRASRVKGPGNAYLTKNIVERSEQSSCALESSEAPVDCRFTPSHPGFYEFVATVADTRGREQRTKMNGWVTGRGNVLWSQSNDATLQIVPERNQYKVGETARYLVKNPFPGAKALVTVERYGVLDSWVQTLESSTPVIEVPIRADYLPGYYLSVVVVSPRVEQPINPEKVDLGKPSYRLGYASARVKDPFKELAIDVEVDKPVYKPREKVTASIEVDLGKANGEPVEIAVVVVDESVLALNAKGERYYDPYAGFNRLDSLDVANYSLMSRLVGRQKFEKKGADPGGGGSGAAYSALRNLFKFVSYWNPSIKPDEHGRATVEFDVPDNLTGWRVLALAVTPNDRMGLGHSNFKVNRPTELRPVMPNQLVEGDTFEAGFTVMNRTDSLRELDVTISVEGPLSGESAGSYRKTVKVAPYKRTNISFPVTTRGSGELEFNVRAGDDVDTDAVNHTVPVHKRRSLETAANYGTTVSDTATDSISIPEQIYPDVGGISLVLSPSVIGNIDGAFEYVRGYPYLCWEQRLTKAVMASSYIALNSHLQKDLAWRDPNADVTGALNLAASYQAPNGGMAYWRASNQFVSPYLSAYTAIAFNWLRRDGYAIPSDVETRLHGYLKKMLREDVFPTFFSKGMSSSVRAVALAALAGNGKLTVGDIERFILHVPEMDLFGKSHFLRAVLGADAPSDRIQSALDTILRHASQTGGKFQFNELLDDSYRYILATPLRSNCSILSSLLLAQTDSAAGSGIGDIPFKLVRTITQARGKRDHWENTQENVFCVNALIDYSRLYESVDPSFSVDVALGDEHMASAEFISRSDPPVTVSRPLGEDDPGRKTVISIRKTGEGRLYYSTRLSYDPTEDRASRTNSGIEIRREYSVERDGDFQLLESPMEIARGEVVRVDLYVSVPTARHFVVVDDPVPGGLEPVNKELATSSTVDVEKGAFKAAAGSWWFNVSDWRDYGRYFWSFYHKELRHDSARFFADYLPAGNYRLSYTAQAISEGSFTVMPVHIEEMYDPDVYGKGLPARLNVSH